MPQHWLDIVSFLAIYALAIIVPGANIAMVLNTSLAGSSSASQTRVVQTFEEANEDAVS